MLYIFFLIAFSFPVVVIPEMKRMFQREKYLFCFFLLFCFLAVSSSSHLHSASGFYSENGLLAVSPELGACIGLSSCAAAPPTTSRRVAWVAMAEASWLLLPSHSSSKHRTNKAISRLLFVLGES